VATGGFCFKNVKGVETRYTTSEKENLAVVFGLRKFRHCLYWEKFEVITDHIGLTWLLELLDPKERLARWIVEIQTYNFDVLYEHDDGELMAIPDALSRDTMDKDIVLWEEKRGWLSVGFASRKLKEAEPRVLPPGPM
jgi:RNase H-like domain found in reverse transcriptase